MKIKSGTYKIKFILNISKSIYDQTVNRNDVYSIICKETKSSDKMMGYLVGDPLGNGTIIKISKDLETDLIYKQDYCIVNKIECKNFDLEKAATKMQNLNKIN